MSFEDFLKSRGLTPNLVQFIIYSISSVPAGVPFREGLKATQTFLHSLGRYGNTPYIFPLYGSGDVHQGFCRYAAVYLGIYCLNRSVQSLVVEQEEGRCTGVVCTSGQPIRCSHLVTGPRLLSVAMDTSSFTAPLRVSRAVLLTDHSLKPDESPGISILSVPPHSLGERQIPVIAGIELDASSCCCPVGTYLVHLSCTSSAATAREDLYPFVNAFLTTPEREQGEAPRLLWSLFYNQEWIKIDQQRCHGNASPLPPNVHMVSDPDLSVDYASCLDEARSVFQLMYPEEEFFPQPAPQLAPQPELEEEELPQQEQQVGEEGKELTHEAHKNEVDEGEGGGNAARAAEETVSAAEAFN